MEKIIFAEILGRNGRVKERLRLDRFPATIGAAYTNDVILGDAYVAMCEARIDLNEQGALTLVDSGSINGIVNRASRRRVNEASLCSGDVFRFGHADVRFMFSDHPVAEPLVIKAGVLDLFSLGRNPWLLTLLAVVIFSALMLSGYLAQTSSFQVSEWLTGATSLLLGLLLITGLWAAGTRLVSHEFRFLQHLAVLSLILLLSELVEIAIAHVEFIFSPDDSLQYASMLMYGTVAVMWIFTHLCVVSRRGLVSKFMISFFLVGSLSAMVQLQLFLSDDVNSGELMFASEIRPVGQGMISFVTLDELFAEAQGLKAHLDNDAEDN